MSSLARTDTSLLGRWWWTVDRWALAAIGLIVGFGALLVLASSPAVAQRIGLDPFHFVRRHFVLLPVAAGLLVAASLLSPRAVRRVSAVGFLVCLALLVLTLVFGAEIKGARRWLNLGGFSLQASEFIKPFFAVVSAWMFAAWRKGDGFPGHVVAVALYLLVVALLLLQPDLGMTVVVSAVWFAQFFLAGLPIALVLGFAGLGAVGLIAAYFVFPHVTSRIDRFLDPSSGDNFQVDRALEAFTSGGLFGRGPGEGTVKGHLPDAHADFVFAVAGEEFGAIACLLLILLYGFVVLRGFARLFGDHNLFVLLAGTGILVQFGLQAVIHMASSVHLMPAKGMTLPFISYGGSSLLALSIGLGMALALTRRRAGAGESL